ncbi:AMP-binding protein [Streptomyces sp. NPDC004237]|uniref:AMP-binding protein n=1 Tax=Streptomyces sp. NPDC004237 TaxID=3154455 RepID=UPI0033A22239
MGARRHGAAPTRCPWTALFPPPTRRATSPDDTTVLLYTSGTTGKPKGAELTHFQIFMNCTTAGALFGVTPDDIAVAVLPLFHVFGLCAVLGNMLRYGAGVVLIPRFEPQAVLDAIERRPSTPARSSARCSRSGGRSGEWSCLPSVTGGTTRAISPTATTRAMCSSWTGSRTSSSAVATTSTRARWRRLEEVVAYVAVRSGAVATADDVLAFVKERVAAYKYPREIHMVPELPKGPTGKILKGELRG